jgi:multiple sugar transport system ATP-binding protein
MTVKLEKVAKSFGSVKVLHDLDLDVTEGEFLVLLGASGSGKTTALRMIAGLESVTSGMITIAGRDVTNVPKNRDVAMVSVLCALPHKTVAENIGYPLKLRVLGRPSAMRRSAKLQPRCSLGRCSTATRANFQAVSVNAWRWRGPWCGDRRCS